MYGSRRFSSITEATLPDAQALFEALARAALALEGLDDGVDGVGDAAEFAVIGDQQGALRIADRYRLAVDDEVALRRHFGPRMTGRVELQVLAPQGGRFLHAGIAVGVAVAAVGAGDQQQGGQDDVDRLVTPGLEDGGHGGDDDDLEQAGADHRPGPHPQHIEHGRHEDEAAADAHDGRQDAREAAEHQGWNGADIETRAGEPHLQRQAVQPQRPAALPVRDDLAADAAQDLRLERLVQLRRVLHQARAALRRPELSHQTGRVPGGTGRQLPLLEDDNVAPAEPGQVVRDAGTDDAATDDEKIVHASSNLSVAGAGAGTSAEIRAYVSIVIGYSAAASEGASCRALRAEMSGTGPVG